MAKSRTARVQATASAAHPAWRAARWVLVVHLIVSPLLFSSATLEEFEFNKVAALQLSALLAGTLALLAVAASEGWDARRLGVRLTTAVREPVTLGAILFTLSAAVSTVWSVSPATSLRGAHESFAGLGTVVAYLLLFLATRGCCATAADGWRLVSAAAVGVAVTAAYALVQVLRLDPFTWDSVSHLAGYDRPFAGLGHANLLGAYLVMGTPLAGALALRAARAGRGTIAAALAAVTLAAVAGVVASLSRGAWVALAGVAAFAVAVRLSPTRERGNLHPRSRVGLTLCLPIILFPLLLVGLLAARADLRSQLFERVRRFGDGAGRVETWQAALAMFREHPLTGVGLDCFQTAYGTHRSLAFWQREYDATPGKAHNEVLHVLATQGLLGGAAGLLLTVGLALAVRRAFRRAASADARLLLTALAAGVVGFSLQSFFGFTVAATGSLFVTLAAVIVRLSSAETKVLSAESSSLSTQHSALSTFSPAVAVAAALAAAWPLIGTPYWADHLARAADDVHDDSPAEALRGYEAAVRIDPGRDVLWLKLSQGAWSAAAAERDGAARLRFGLRARAAAEEAVALRPALAAYRLGLGRILSGLSHFGVASADDALGAFDAGLALDPRNPHYLALAGEAASDLGHPDRARDYLNRGLALDPSSAALRAGLGRVAMAERRFDEADAQLAAAVSTDWHGDADGFLTAVALRAACLVELRRPREAAALVRDVVRERPGWPGPHFTLANALAQLGRPEAAPEYRAVVDLAPDHPFAAAAQRWLADHRR